MEALGLEVRFSTEDEKRRASLERQVIEAATSWRGSRGLKDVGWARESEQWLERAVDALLKDKNGEG